MTKCAIETCNKKFGMFSKEYVCVVCKLSICKQCSVKNVSFPNERVIIGQRVCNPCVDKLNASQDPTGGLTFDLSGASKGPRNSTLNNDPHSQLNTQLEEMMEEQQLNPQARDRMRAMDITSKYQVLSAYRNAAASKPKARDPLDVVDELGSQGKAAIWSNPESMRKLCMSIKSEGKTWALQFVNGGGMQSLLEGIVTCSNIEVKSVALEAVFSFVRTSTGLAAFLQNTESINSLKSFVLNDTDEIKCITAHIFAYILSSMDEDAYGIVCTTMATPVFARLFVKNLETTENIKVAMNLMILLNAMVNNADLCEDRTQLRLLFQQNGINDAILRLTFLLDSKYNNCYSRSKRDKQQQ